MVGAEGLHLMLGTQTLAAAIFGSSFYAWKFVPGRSLGLLPLAH